MKSAEAIKSAVAKYEALLKETRDKIAEDEEWQSAARKMKEGKLFQSLGEDIERLTAGIPEIEFKIRFAKWVLE